VTFQDVVRTKFVPACDAYAVDPATPWPRSLRVKSVQGAPGILEMTLRHSYATAALRAGLNPKVISERIGHADVAFFLQTYAHVLRSDDRDVAEQAAAFLIGDALDPPEDSAQESGASD
jgi:hypothetical protein